MANAVQCPECQAILEEFRSACAEMPLEINSQFWSDRNVFTKLIGGTEEDVERLEELGEGFRFPPRLPGSNDERERYYSRLQNALGRMVVHRFRTGHNELFNQFFKR